MRVASQGADTPVPVPVPVPDLSGDGDGASVPDLAGDGDAPPSPIPIGGSAPCKFKLQPRRASGLGELPSSKSATRVRVPTPKGSSGRAGRPGLAPQPRAQQGSPAAIKVMRFAHRRMRVRAEHCHSPAIQLVERHGKFTLLYYLLSHGHSSLIPQSSPHC